MTSSPRRLLFVAMVAVLPTLVFANQAEGGGRRRCRNVCPQVCCEAAPAPSCGCTGGLIARGSASFPGGVHGAPTTSPDEPRKPNFTAATCADTSLRRITQGGVLVAPLTMASVTDIGFTANANVRLVFFNPTNYSAKWGYL